jgi:hypothetical protein
MREVPMLNNHKIEGNQDLPSKSNTRIIIDLQYLTTDQARQLIEMFDSPEAYAENFSAIKAITRGLYKVIEDTHAKIETPIARMFHVVNEMQGTLMRDDMREHERIINNSGLMPDPWCYFRSRKGGSAL